MPELIAERFNNILNVRAFLALRLVHQSFSVGGSFSEGGVSRYISRRCDNWIAEFGEQPISQFIGRNTNADIGRSASYNRGNNRLARQDDRHWPGPQLFE